MARWQALEVKMQYNINLKGSQMSHITIKHTQIAQAKNWQVSVRVFNFAMDTIKKGLLE